MTAQRTWVAVVLLLRFLWQVVVSGVATAWIIIRPGIRPRPALVRMPITGLSETGAALLASMITLTPGTTAIDIDMQRGELLLHLLDGADPDGAVAGIRRSFEPPLLILFPAKKEASP